MRAGKHIKLTANIGFRAELLVNEYTKKCNCDEEILNALNSLQKYIGEKNRERFTKMISEKKYREFSIELMEKYYDPMYENKSNDYDYNLELEVEDIDRSVTAIEEWWNRQGDNFQK
jgi:tRNA 2-selenouridine synthase